MGIEWAASADRHGIDREHALQAINSFKIRITKFDDSRVDAESPDLFIGRDSTGRMLEVFAVVDGNEIFIFHVMELRLKTYERAREALARRQEEKHD